MKKIKILLTMAVAVVSIMLFCSLTTFALTEGDWEFSLLDNEVTITKYVGQGGDVVIPESIYGCPVTKLEKSLLYHYYSPKIMSVKIEAKIKEIPATFAGGQDQLEQITLPEGIETIQERAFEGCESLKTIKLPSTLKTLYNDVFKNCTSLSSAKLPEGIESVGGGCFAYTAITEMDVSNISVVLNKRFGSEKMFEGCKNLKRVVLSPMVETIAEKTFINCTSLEEVVIPNGVKVIGDSAFEGCKALKNVIFPTTLEEIGWGAFNSTGLVQVVLPYGAKKISISAFSRCQDLEAVYIPDTVSDILLNPVKDCPKAIVYCSEGSYAAQYCKEEGISYLTDNSVNSGIHVFYNGKRISFHSYAQNPEILEGRTLVPLRSIFEAMGADVEWDGATSTATAKRGATTVNIQIGANSIYKNGQAISVDVPAQLLNGRTMVPARVIAEAFGADVQWNGNGRTVIITE